MGLLRPDATRIAYGMRKHPVYLTLLVAMVLALLVVISTRSREVEPVYGGKRLGLWLQDCSAIPSNQAGYGEARHALRHIRTNALPFLLEWIRYEAPPWKTTLYGGIN